MSVSCQADTCTTPRFKINGRAFELRGVAREPGDDSGERSFVLSTPDGDPAGRIEVRETPWGCSCSCEDGEYRLPGFAPLGCAHVRALALLGFVAEANPYRAASEGGA